MCFLQAFREEVKDLSAISENARGEAIRRVMGAVILVKVILSGFVSNGKMRKPLHVSRLETPDIIFCADRWFSNDQEYCARLHKRALGGFSQRLQST
ncbi:MAG: hypothetical protein DRH70_04395 [Candidatus Coatesbacteria bacterium]|nr:MAG: hypothetical protein DRH70_04395 [Candidatus Coatesbacteria bacterium]